jgi:hypothetical protein
MGSLDPPARVTIMNRSALRRTCAAAACSALVIIGVYAGLSGQAAPPQIPTVLPLKAEAGYTVPRTKWGHPDLQGTWENSEEIGIPIEKPATTKILATQEEAFEEADRRGGVTGAGPGWWYETKPSTGRTYQLIDPPDGKLPPLTPWAEQIKQEAARSQNGGLKSYRDLPVSTRCLTRGVPGSMVPGFFMYNAGYQIMQTPQYVAIRYEMIHDIRVIPLDGRPHIGNDIRLWMGDARGRWDGDTLVIETTNLNDSTPLLGFNSSVPGSVMSSGINEQTRVIEKFTRVNGRLITYLATIENPKVFTRAWTIAVPLNRDDSYTIFEYACHEGNKGVVNILTAARAAEPVPGTRRHQEQ